MTPTEQLLRDALEHLRAAVSNMITAKGHNNNVEAYNRLVNAYAATMPDEIAATSQQAEGEPVGCEVNEFSSRVCERGTQCCTTYHNAAHLPAQPQGQGVVCPHRIADARNPIVTSGYVCIDCGALFATADHAPPSQAPEPAPDHIGDANEMIQPAQQEAAGAEPSDEQIESAIKAYDETWNPANRGHENKFEAIKAAILAASLPSPAPLHLEQK